MDAGTTSTGTAALRGHGGRFGGSDGGVDLSDLQRRTSRWGRLVTMYRFSESEVVSRP